MKSIVLKHYSRVSGGYEVHLGNGTVHRFKSTRSAKKFLATTNDFLSEQLVILNEILTELYVFYRGQWLLTDKLIVDKEFETNLIIASDVMRGALSCCAMKDANLMVFVNLKKTTGMMKKIIKSFNAILTKRKNDTISKHKMTTLFRRVMSAEKDLSDYGQLDSYSLFDTEKYDALTDIIYKNQTISS
jgi:hypothetical protein